MNKQKQIKPSTPVYNNILNPGRPQVDNKVKPVNSRPNSAKVGSVNPEPNIKDKNYPANNNVLLRKDNSERPASPKILNPTPNYNLKRPIINNSPRKQSPLNDNLINMNAPLLRPSSGKDRVSNNLNNNPILLRNDKKVLIEKVNYEKGALQPRGDKKPNYHYLNPQKDQLIVNNRNNLVNAMKVNENLLHRPSSNQGPKIVYINQRK